MVQALLWGGVAVASFAAAAVLVFAIVRMSASSRVARRLSWRADHAWWPEFERAFEEYVRAGDRPRS
jgi:hypothetical protein